MKKIIWFFLFIMMSALSFRLEAKTPPYKINDNHYIQKDFEDIYFLMTTHNHGGEDSSRVQDLIASSDTYSLGSALTPWATGFINLLVFANGTQLSSAQLGALSAASLNFFVDNQNNIIISSFNVPSSQFIRSYVGAGSSITLSLNPSSVTLLGSTPLAQYTAIALSTASLAANISALSTDTSTLLSLIKATSALSSAQFSAAFSSISTLQNSTATLSVRADGFDLFLTTAQIRFESFALFRTTAEIKIDALGTSTTTIFNLIASTYLFSTSNFTAAFSSIAALGTSTQTLALSIGDLNVFRSTAQSRIDNLDSSTQSLTTRVTNLEIYRSTTDAKIDALNASTTTLASSISALGTSTQAISSLVGDLLVFRSTAEVKIDALSASTMSLRSSIDANATTNANQFSAAFSSIAALGTSTQAINALVSDLLVFRSTAEVKIDALSASTVALQSSINSHAATDTAQFTAAFSSISALGTSTQTLLSRANDIDVFRSTAQIKIDSWTLSQSTISSRLDDLNVFRSTAQIKIDALNTSTGTLYSLISTTSTNAVRVDGSTQTKLGGLNVVGRVGIGTSNPLTPLVSSNGDGKNIEFSFSPSLDSNVLESIDRKNIIASDMSYYIGSSTHAHRFYTSGTEKMRIDGTGNVGIGTLTPNSKLHVVPSDGYSSGWLKGIVSTGASIVENGNAAIGMHTDKSMYFMTKGLGDYTSSGWGTSIAMKIQNDGDVGIGSIYPESNLHVSGSIPIITLQGSNEFLGPQFRFRDSAGTLASPSIPTQPDFYAGALYWDAYDGSAWQGVGAFLVNGDGNPTATSLPTAFNFLTTSPNSVNASVKAQLNSTGDMYVNSISTSDSHRFAVGTFSPDAGVKFQVMPSTFVVLSTGAVGIGTISPSQKLTIVDSSVNGAQAYLQSFRSSSGSNSQISFSKARGTPSAPSSVSLGDSLGQYAFNGYDGTSYVPAASIIASVDGVTGTNDMPGRIGFRTTPDGASATLERMAINNGGYVGIGTSDPQARLNVFESQGSVLGTLLSSNFGHYIRMIPGTCDGCYNGLVKGGDNVLIYSSGTANTGGLVIGQWRSDATLNGMRFDPGGNVGIGSAGPVQKLDVAGSINMTGTTLYTNGSSANYGSLTIDGSKVGWSGINFKAGGSNRKTLMIDATYSGIYNNADNGWDWYWSGGTLVQGTIPGANVSGNISGSAGTLAWEDNRVVAPSELSANSMKFGFTSYSQNNAAPWADFLHLRSYTDNSGGNDNLLVINRSGVGMRLYQQTYGSASAYSSYKDIVLAENSPSANYLLKYSGTGTSVSVTNSSIFDNGNVGIGTTNPGAKLEVNGNIRAKGDFPSGGGGYQFSSPGDTDGGMFSNSDGTLDFYTDNSPRVRINSSGSVGIGTTNPGAALDVKSNGPTINLTGTDHTYIQFYPDGAAAGRKGYLGYPGAGIDDIYVANEISGADIILLTNGGNVGIGSTAPTAKLDVNGSVKIIQPYSSSNPILNLTSSDAGPPYQYTAIKMSLGSYSHYIKQDLNDFIFQAYGDVGTYGSYKFAIGQSTPVVISYAGNVGIGTTNPGAKLHVYGSGNEKIALTNSSLTSPDRSSLGIDSSEGFQILTGRTNSNHNNFTLRTGDFDNSSSARLTVLGANGNVGIGTNNPAYQLELNTDSAGKPTTNTWTITSDSRTKEDISEYTVGLNEIKQIRPVTFAHNGLGGTRKGDQGVGVLAQEMRSIFPQTVTEREKIFESTDDVKGFDAERVVISSAVTRENWTVFNEPEGLMSGTTFFQKDGGGNGVVFKDNSFYFLFPRGNTGKYAEVKNTSTGFVYNLENGGFFSAQSEVVEVSPEKYGYKAKILGFNSHELTFALVNAIKELSTTVDDLKKRIEILEAPKP